MENKEKSRLVVFDVEGVLIPRNMFFFQLGRVMGFFTLTQILLYRLLYEVGIYSLDTSLKRIFEKIKGQKIEILQRVFEQISTTHRLQDFFAQIKSENRKCQIVLISSSLPKDLVEWFANSLGADYAYGINVQVNTAKEITGEISGEVIEDNGKIKIVQQILTKENLTLRDCVVVARDRSARCLYIKETKKIGYNPNVIIRIKSEHVITGSLSNILPILDNNKDKRSLPSVNDLVRENIHAAGIFTPILAHVIGSVIPIIILISAISIIYFASEIARLNGKNIPVISTITRRAASPSELYGFAAAPLFYAIGILLALLLLIPFPDPESFRVITAAITMFTLGDSAASIFGGTIGIRLPFNKGKTLEGSLVGFTFAFLAGSLFIVPWIAVIGATIAMFVEYLPLPINDNILIPITTATSLMLLLHLLI
ncbi:MAG: haloacid dehalogenase-like hydrolase [Nitrososphaerota archaeon]|jgi:dolichol kinase/phosphoserine phosphatase|nr:haloacid dehalogenase-like hydrolase [Nitrososphaerota archaeon]